MAESKPKNISKSFRLTPTCKALIAKLAAAMGINSSSVVEIAVRDLAKREGIRLE